MMMIKRALVLFMTFCFCVTPLLAMDLDSNSSLDSETMLRTELPPKPKFFGLRFANTPQEALKTLGKMGLRLVGQDSKDEKGIVKVFSFQGLPDDLPIKDGTTQLIFFKNKLVRMDFFFEPSHQNFLLLKSGHLNQLPDRLHIGDKREVMDYYLKTQLAHLRRGEFNTEIQEKVKQSIIEGKTFYHYTINDSQNELSATLTYSAKQSPKGIQPNLHLHYSLKEGMEDLQNFQLTDGKERAGKTPLNRHTIKVSQDYP